MRVSPSNKVNVQEPEFTFSKSQRCGNPRLLFTLNLFLRERKGLGIYMQLCIKAAVTVFMCDRNEPILDSSAKKPFSLFSSFGDSQVQSSAKEQDVKEANKPMEKGLFYWLLDSLNTISFHLYLSPSNPPNRLSCLSTKIKACRVVRFCRR